MKGEKEKDSYTFKLNFYFWGLQLFCDVEYFPEPVQGGTIKLSP